MVITLDFESSNPGSNPGRTCTAAIFFLCVAVYMQCCSARQFTHTTEIFSVGAILLSRLKISKLRIMQIFGEMRNNFFMRRMRDTKNTIFFPAPSAVLQSFYAYLVPLKFCACACFMRSGTKSVIHDSIMSAVFQSSYALGSRSSMTQCATVYAYDKNI